MKFLTKIFNNPSKVVILIVAFVLLFLSYEAFSLEVEGGPTYTSEFNGGFGVVLSERVGRFDLGLSLISEQSWEAVNIGNNGNVWAAFVVERPDGWFKALPSEASLGPSVWIRNQSPINGCLMGYTLGLKWRFGDHFSAGIRHWSNAGICKPNRGQDLLTIGWRF